MQEKQDSQHRRAVAQVALSAIGSVRSIARGHDIAPQLPRWENEDLLLRGRDRPPLPKRGTLAWFWVWDEIRRQANEAAAASDDDDRCFAK